jgi:hypothetical protein
LRRQGAGNGLPDLWLDLPALSLELLGARRGNGFRDFI